MRDEPTSSRYMRSRWNRRTESLPSPSLPRENASTDETVDTGTFEHELNQQARCDILHEIARDGAIIGYHS